MNIPNQFTLSDWVIFYLFGLITILIGNLYMWNFWGINILNIITGISLAEIIILIAFPYLIGQLFATMSFSYLLRLSVTSPIKPLNRLQKLIGKYLFGISTKPDSRLIPFEESEELNNIVRHNIKETFSVDVDKINDKSKREIFYTTIRFIENYSDNKVIILERENVRTNLFASLVTASLIFIVLNTIAIIAKMVQGIGLLSLTQLIIIELSVVILLRRFGFMFQRTLLLWWKNVWRIFIALNAKTVSKEVNSKVPNN